MWRGVGDEQAQRVPDAARLTTIELVDAWPEIQAFVPSADLPLAGRTLLAPVIAAHDEDVFELLGTRARGALGFLVVEGVVLKVTTLAGRAAPRKRSSRTASDAVPCAR